MYITFPCRASSCNKPRHTPCILERRFTLTPTTYKYLDVGNVVGPVSFMEIAIGSNQDNNIILPRAMWRPFIERRADIGRFVQSIAP